jgi:hypothetical protein
MEQSVRDMDATLQSDIASGKLRVRLNDPRFCDHPKLRCGDTRADVYRAHRPKLESNADSTANEHPVTIPFGGTEVYDIPINAPHPMLMSVKIQYNTPIQLSDKDPKEMQRLVHAFEQASWAEEGSDQALEVSCPDTSLVSALELAWDDLFNVLTLDEDLVQGKTYSLHSLTVKNSAIEAGRRYPVRNLSGQYWEAGWHDYFVRNSGITTLTMALTFTEQDTAGDGSAASIQRGGTALSE